MKIKRLQIDSFGKFENREISFSDGINVINGENESGKTTAEQFIINALYGFFRRDVKGRRTLPSYDKYRPWNNPGRFSGRITVQNGENEYTVIRNFIKTRPSVTVLNGAGEDITEEFEYNSGLKIYDPAPKIIGLSRTAFENTLCVSQRECAAVNSLGEELSEKLSSISQSADTDISVVTASAYLDKKLSDIGNERKNSLYKTVKTKISELENERAAAINAESTFFELKDAQGKLEAERKALKDEAAELENKIAALHNNAELKKLERAQKISSVIKLNDDRIQELKPYENTDLSEISDTFGKLEALKNLRAVESKQREKLNELKAEKNEVSAQLDNCGLKSVSASLLNEFSQNKIGVQKYFEIKREIEEFDSEESSARFDTIIKTYDDLIREKSAIINNKKQKYTLFILALLTISVGILLSFIRFPFILIPLLGLVPAFFALRIKTDTAETDEKIRRLFNENHLSENCTRDELISMAAQEKSRETLKETQLNAQKSELNILESRLDAYFSLLTSMDWRTQMASISASVEKAKQLTEKSGELEIKIKTADESVGESSRAAEKLQSEIAEVFSAYGVVNAEGLSTCRDKKSEFDECRRSRNALSQELERLLDGISMDELAAKCKNLEFIETDENEDTINTVLSRVRSASESCAERLSAVNERISAVAESTRTVGEINADLKEQKKLLDEMDLRKNALSMAKERLQNISRELHNEFAPRLNRAISDCAKFISDGKYTSLRLTKEFDLFADTAECAEPVPAELLSGGTADMVYLAARIALTDFLSGDGEKLPMIFDDSFVFLDRPRLEKFLEYISQSGRQILIFTCHDTEREILSEKNIPFSEITL